MSSTAVARRDAMTEVCTTIAGDAFVSKIRQALPDNITPEKFVRTTLTAIQQNPDVVKGTRDSLYNAVIRCAQDGLKPDGKEAALVIYKDKGVDKVRYMPMLEGLRRIAAEHQASIVAYVVYENDEFEVELGLDPSVTHRPAKLGAPRGDAIGAYAVGTDANGRKYLEVMSREEIEHVRKSSRAANSEYGPWVNHWGEMARKTVARRLFKALPLADVSERAQRVIAADDRGYDFSPGPLSDLPVVDVSDEEIADGDLEVHDGDERGAAA